MMMTLALNAEAQKSTKDQRVMAFQTVMALHDTTYKNLIKDGKYEEAIEWYRKCLDYHAEGFFAEFEIVEAYLQLRDYGNAEKVLASIRPGLNLDTDKAMWLRRSGFIAIEKREYELAYALYVYSLSFEDNAIAHDEINYIVYTAPGTRPFTADEAESAVLRAVGIENARREKPLTLEEGVTKRIASACGGDVRKALNAVELLFSTARDTVTLEDARAVTQRSAMRYDRDGDEHFDCLSALMKSLRGSDPDAALHYLARLLEAGDLIGASRRILCSASEDIGLAYPQAVPIVKACVDSALQLGLPEARLPLAEACLLLATAPKSNSACVAIDRASADLRAGKGGSIPRELQNVHADGTGFEREQGYLYPHDYPGHWVKQQYLPDELKNATYYEYGDNKTEQAAKRYWEAIKPDGYPGR